MNKVYLYSMPRTGSTLIWQILIRIFGKDNVIRDHACLDIFKEEFNYEIDKDYLFIPYRDFKDITISYWRSNSNIGDNETKISPDELLRWAQEVENDVIVMNEYREKISNVCFLKYELFYNDFDYVFELIEKYCNMNIEDETKSKIKEECNIEANKKIQSQYETFNNYDNESMIHGNHINIKDNGKPGCWADWMLPENSLEIESFFKKYSKQWGYL